MTQNSRQKHFATFWIHCETAKFSAWKFFDNKVIQTACHKNFDHENLSCRNKIRSFGKELLKELFSSENAHFLNKNLCEPLEVIQSGNKLLTDLYIKPPDTHQHLEFSSCHVYRLKNLFQMASLSVLIGFVQKIGFLITVQSTWVLT